MELDQAAHGSDVVGRIPQGAHPLLGHAGPDDLVVVERHTVRSEGARLGLPHVVEQRRQPQDPVVARGALDDGDGVGQHVLVAVDGVLLQAEGRQLGQELVGQARLDEEPQAPARLLDDQQLVELIADALGGDDLEPGSQLTHGLDKGRVGREVVAGDEAGGPQHAEGVVAEGLLR